MMTKIIRKDGIEFERKKKNVNYNKSLNFRVSEQLIEDLKILAEKNNVTYNKFIRNILEKYVSENKINN